MCPGAPDPVLQREVFDPCPVPLSISALADTPCGAQQSPLVNHHFCSALGAKSCCGPDPRHGSVHKVGGDTFHREELHCLEYSLIKRDTVYFLYKGCSLLYSISATQLLGLLRALHSCSEWQDQETAEDVTGKENELQSMCKLSKSVLLSARRA